MTIARQSDRAFGLTFAAVFAMVSAMGWFVFDTTLVWAMVLSGVLLVLALAAPVLLLPINRLWHPVARRIGIALNHVLLGTFFFVVISPIGLAMRLFGRDTMARRYDPAAASYFNPVARQLRAETLRDLF
ncbi:MAG: hypothetical protein EXQ90_04390 [Rhodospirillales bacterium]|nr:hypothetical protein [Rhodospirillales bacterium]